MPATGSADEGAERALLVRTVRPYPQLDDGACHAPVRVPDVAVVAGAGPSDRGGVVVEQLALAVGQRPLALTGEHRPWPADGPEPPLRLVDREVGGRHAGLGSRGRPRTISATMLRWMANVPPPSVSAGANRKP